MAITSAAKATADLLSDRSVAECSCMGHEMKRRDLCEYFCVARYVPGAVM